MTVTPSDNAKTMTGASSENTKTMTGEPGENAKTMTEAHIKTMTRVSGEITKTIAGAPSENTTMTETHLAKMRKMAISTFIFMFFVFFFCYRLTWSFKIGLPSLSKILKDLRSSDSSSTSCVLFVIIFINSSYSIVPLP